MQFAANSEMSEFDRQKWNARYLEGRHASEEPSVLLTSAEAFLPRSGKALDLAGGGGRHAIWLAKRGLDVTLADVSDEGLKLAERRAAEHPVSLRLVQVDLESDPMPAGPWNLIVLLHYLHRPLFAKIPLALARGGILFFVQPTVRNLERHEKPPRPFLLDEGEAPRLIHGLEILRYEEDWLAEGRHDALVIARRGD
jgi:2-polyprenyl-3-methyl-5-hydroxy-6-metoxy-1,4-benzoquinol methylase